MSSASNAVNARMKVYAYKNEENPDGRETLCGEARQFDENGREFFIVPAHQKEYLKQILPSYEYSEEFEAKKVDGKFVPVDEAPKMGRRARGK